MLGVGVLSSENRHSLDSCPLYWVDTADCTVINYGCRCIGRIRAERRLCPKASFTTSGRRVIDGSRCTAEQRFKAREQCSTIAL